MLRKTMKMLVVALVAAFALSSMAEAAPRKTVRHRAKHSSRVSSGEATAGKKPAAKKKRAAASSRTHARSRKSATGTAQKPGAKKAPAKHRPATKPH
jgi:hypothetical protein